MLFCAAIVAAMMLTACGGKTVQLDEQGQAAFEEVTEMLKAEAAKTNDQVEVSLRGNDLVMCTPILESATNEEYTVKNYVAFWHEMGEKTLAKEFLNNMGYHNCQLLLRFLREYKLNVALQLKSIQTGEVGEFVIHYDNLPNY